MCRGHSAILKEEKRLERIYPTRYQVDARGQVGRTVIRHKVDCKAG